MSIVEFRAECGHTIKIIIIAFLTQNSESPPSDCVYCYVVTQFPVVVIFISLEDETFNFLLFEK